MELDQIVGVTLVESIRNFIIGEFPMPCNENMAYHMLCGVAAIELLTMRRHGKFLNLEMIQAAQEVGKVLRTPLNGQVPDTKDGGNVLRDIIDSLLKGGKDITIVSGDEGVSQEFLNDILKALTENN